MAGVDSHKDTIRVAVITGIGQPVAYHEFPTTAAGYRRAIVWLIEHGPPQAVGIEGISSCGRGISTAIALAGISVVEVNRARPAERRKQGKGHRMDSDRAARSVLSGEATTRPKLASIEPLRVRNVARRSALEAQQATWRQIQALLANAPAILRDRLRNLGEAALINPLTSTRPR